MFILYGYQTFNYLDHKILLTSKLLLICINKDGYYAIVPALFTFALEIKLTLTFECYLLHVATNKLGASSFLTLALFLLNALQVSVEILETTFVSFI